jgi:hypothetical protein
LAAFGSTETKVKRAAFRCQRSELTGVQQWNGIESWLSDEFLSSNNEGESAIMANELSIGLDRSIADDMTGAFRVERRLSDETRHDELLYKSHDLAAAQGSTPFAWPACILPAQGCHVLNATRLRSVTGRAPNAFSNGAKRLLAATRNTTAAGGCLLNAKLARFKAELDAFDLAEGAATHLICDSSSAAVSCTRGKDPHGPEVGSTHLAWVSLQGGNAETPKTGICHRQLSFSSVWRDRNTATLLRDHSLALWNRKCI